jgi:hypothetical protein
MVDNTTGTESCAVEPIRSYQKRCHVAKILTQTTTKARKKYVFSTVKTAG